MIRLGFFAGVEYNNRVYFSAYMHNGLYEMDLVTKKVRLVTFFEQEEYLHYLHREAFIYKNEAWFMPCLGKYIAKVNLDTFDISYYNFSVQKNAENTERPYYTFICGKKFDDNKLCFIPRNIDTVVIIDMETSEIREINNAIDPEKECTMDALVLGEELFIFFRENEYYKRINLCSQEKKDFKISNRIWSIEKNGNEVWMMTEESQKMIHYDLKSKKIVHKIDLGGKKKYRGIISNGKEIICLPICAPGFLRVDVVVGDMFEDIPVEVQLAEDPVKIMMVDSEKNKYFTIGEKGLLSEISEKNQMIYSKIEILEKDFWGVLSKYIKTKEEWSLWYKGIVASGVGDYLGANGMIKLIKYMDKTESNIEKNTGRLIWTKIKEKDIL